ncbi:MAG TPA: hypothetical protein VGH11_03645 [Jatrophihabitans sp.]|jgi:hypothetical protein
MIGQAMKVSAQSTPSWAKAAAVVVIAVLIGLGARSIATAQPDHHPKAFPQSASMEDRYGIRFSRIAVVGDGGLITVSYVVLDPEKATRFQSDVAHPPTLKSESRKGTTSRVSLMKQGHSLRAGQTYYLVYENTKGALKHSELATIVDGDLQLRHVPVL